LLTRKGLMLKRGSIVDATIIAAPSLCIPTERDRGFRRMMTAESDDVDQ